MKLKSILAISCLSLITACQTSTVSQSKSYTPSTDARIRLYGQNQKPTILEYKVNGEKEKINVGGGLGDALSSMVGTIDNSSIGIPQTEMSTHLKDYNGVLSKIFYKEFVIPSSTPVSVRGAFLGLSNISATPTGTTVYSQGSCNSLVLTFTPQAGKDYEVIPQKGASCGLILLEIDATGNTKQVTLRGSSN